MSNPVFPLDPPGINAAGNGSIWFVPAIADPSAPTVEEIEAGIDLSCALYTFTPTFEQASVTRTKYCYREAVQAPGRVTRSIERIVYDYDPQDPASEEYSYYEELTEGRRGFIVDRRGLHAKSVEIASGQYVHVTPVELGARDDVAINPEEEGEKLRVEQIIHVIGEKIRDAEVNGPGDGA